MVTYKKLFEKFEEKGYVVEFHLYVGAPMIFDPSIDELRTFGLEFLSEQRQKLNQNRYQPEWEYWNTWIDYQQYKF